MATFRTLFDLRITHDYYQSGVTPDIVVRPTPETIKRLSAHRLLLRVLNDRIKVLYLSAPDATDPLIDTDGLRLDFAIDLLNGAEFLNFTDLDTNAKNFEAGNLLFYENDPVAQQALDPTILDGVRGRQFAYQLPIVAADPATHEATLEIQDAQGASVETLTNLSPNDQGFYLLALDLTKRPTGRYRLISSDTTQGPVTQTFLLDDQLNGAASLGLIEITVGPSSLQEYSIGFVRKSRNWAYYLVNKSGISITDFDFEVDDESGDDGSMVYDSYTFSGSQTPDPADAVQGIDTLVFTSDQAIPFYDQPKLSLRLKQIDNNAPPPQATSVLIQNLPNPQPAAAPKAGGETAIYIYL